MSYLTIQINTASIQVGDLTTDLGDSTKPREGLQNIKNLIDALEAGTASGTVTATSSTNAGTVSGQTGGTTVTYNLT